LEKVIKTPILQSFADQPLWIVPEVLGCLTKVHLSTDVSLFYLFIGLALSDSCCSEEPQSKEEEDHLN